LIFVVREIIEKIWEFDKHIYLAFTDIEKAYDKNEQEIWKALQPANFSRELMERMTNI
jgi:hypothetical protein